MSNPLTIEFVAARYFPGRAAPQGLSSWLDRIRAVVAAKPPAEAEALRNWALRTVQRLTQPGIIDTVAWQNVEMVPPVAELLPPGPAVGSIAAKLSQARKDLVAEAEEQRRQALEMAVAQRVRGIYHTAPQHIDGVLGIVRRELRVVDEAVASGQLRSYFTVGSEQLLAKVLAPHPVPNMPPALAPAQLHPQAPPHAPPTPTRLSQLQPPPPFAPQQAARHASSLALPQVPQAPRGAHAMNVGPPIGANNGHAPSNDARAARRAQAVTPSEVTLDAIEARMRTFFGAAGAQSRTPSPVSRGPPTFAAGAASPLPDGRIIGTSEELERRYTRDTPKAEELRPRSLLPRAALHVFAKFCAIRDGDASLLGATKVAVGQHPEWEGSRWLSEQLKGMRQDLKVQRIRDAFAVAVYEAHARLCLRAGDPLEYAACQAALHQFYAAGTFSRDDDADARLCVEAAPVGCGRSGVEAAVEFAAYRRVSLTLAGDFSALAKEEQAEASRLELALAGDAAAVGGLVPLTRSGKFDAACAATGVVPAEEEETAVASVMDRAAGSGTHSLDTLGARAEVRRTCALTTAIEARDGPMFTAAVRALHDDAACADVLPGIAGLIAPALQRLRVQWLLAVLGRGARGRMSGEFLGRWLGFPVLDEWCAAHSIGHVNTGPGYPSPAEAWSALWTTIKMPEAAAPALPRGVGIAPKAPATAGSGKATAAPAKGRKAKRTRKAAELELAADDSILAVASGPASVVPEGDAPATDADAIKAALIEYTAFLNSGSSGATAR